MGSRPQLLSREVSITYCRFGARCMPLCKTSACSSECLQEPHDHFSWQARSTRCLPWILMASLLWVMRFEQQNSTNEMYKSCGELRQLAAVQAFQHSGLCLGHCMCMLQSGHRYVSPRAHREARCTAKLAATYHNVGHKFIEQADQWLWLPGD